MSMFLSRNLLILYLGTFIRFVYLRFIKRKDVLFKELLDLVKEGKIKKDDEMDIFTNEMANRSYGCIFLIIIVALPLVLQPINIEGDSISLPLLMMKNDTINNDIITDQELDCIGSWQIISCKPDSIQILVPGHPFSGKYEVVFKKEYFSNQYHFLICLKNDSTNLICEKNESFFSGRPKILENWEN